MKKTVAILLCLLMVLGLFSGCSETPPIDTTPNTTPTDTTPKDTTPADTTPDPVSLDVWLFDDEMTHDLYVDFEANFENEYPWIDLVYTWLPWDTGPEKLTVSFATGAVPDIIIDSYTRLGQAVDSGLTISLEPAISRIEGLSGLPTDGIVNGEHHFLWSASGAAYGLACNMDIATELGITDLLPEDGLSWSYEDFLTCCRKAKEAGYIGIPLWAGSQSSDMWYYSLLLGAGVEITDATVNNGIITKTVFNTDTYRQDALEALNFLKTIVDEGLCQAGPATTTDLDAVNIWFAGQSLFLNNAFSDTTWYLDSIADGTCLVENFEIFAIPTPDGTEGGGDCGAWAASGVVAFDTAAGAKLDAIYTTIAYMWNKESGHMQASQDILPSQVSVLDYVQVDLEALDEAYIRININRGNDYAVEHNRSDWGPTMGWFADFRLTFFPLLQEFYTDQITAEELLAQWETDANDVIANHQVAE